MTTDDDRNPKTVPMPAVDDAAPTEPLSPLPATAPFPADAPPPPSAMPAGTEPAAESASNAGADADALVAAQKRPAVAKSKPLAWSNLPGSEPIPLGAVEGGIDVTGTHPTLPRATPTGRVGIAGAAAAGAAGASTVHGTVPRAVPTAVAPTVAPGSPDAAAPSDADDAARPKKRRRHRALVITLSSTAVVLVLVGVAAVIGWQVAETRALSSVKQTVQQKVDKALGLAASHPVAVTVDEPVLPQVWAGTLDTLTFTVADAPIAGSKGTLTVHATKVPTGETGTPASVDAAVRLKPGSLKTIVSAHASNLGQIVPGSVSVKGSDVTVDLNPAQFLSGVSFTEVLHASVKDGALVLTPQSFVVGGFPMDAATVRDRFGGLAQGILQSRTICLASGYPSGMTLTGLDVKKNAVVADFDVERGILTDPKLQASGTCS